MAKAAFAVRGGALWPLDEDGRELVASVKGKKAVMVSVVAARNVGHHRKFFALLNKVIEGGAYEGTVESLRKAVLIECRHVTPIVLLDGSVRVEPASMSFESMDQVQFERLYERALWVISEKLLGGIGWETLRDEIAAIVDGDLPERRG